jgi:hypothetical protein
MARSPKVLRLLADTEVFEDLETVAGALYQACYVTPHPRPLSPATNVTKMSRSRRRGRGEPEASV